jgi:hypothetical protein
MQELGSSKVLQSRFRSRGDCWVLRSFDRVMSVKFCIALEYGLHVSQGVSWSRAMVATYCACVCPGHVSPGLSAARSTCASCLAWHRERGLGAWVVSVLDYKRNQSDENRGTLGRHKLSPSRVIFTFSIQLTAIDDRWSVLTRELS